MTVAIICARGGSKGVPGKNIRMLAGKPLIAWTIEQALATPGIDHVVVSSDAADIRQAAHEAGASLVVERPASLATDTISVHPAILHALDAAEDAIGATPEAFVYLQPTSPLRLPDDIAGAVSLWTSSRPSSVVSVTEAAHSPYFTLLEERADGAIVLSKPTDPPLARRQDAPRVFQLNGSIYVFRTDAYRQEQRVLFPDTRIYQMPEERSVDIDTELDWALAELLMERRGILRASLSP